MRLDTLKGDYLRCGLTPEICKVLFNDWRKMPARSGLYSIWHGDTCIYVGQGSGRSGIRGRLKHHWNKAHGEFKTTTGRPNGTQDTAAWADGRKRADWVPNAWEVEFFECSSAVARTYLEGAMLLTLGPMCNDESFADRTAV